MDKWSKVADRKTIEQTITALKKNNFNVFFVETIDQAKQKFFEVLPKEASVLTKDGHVLIASRSGSQIPGYAYGADHVIWVVGAQKLVDDIDEGIKRIYD